MPAPCLHRRVFIWPDSRFRIQEKRKEFHPLGLPLLGLTCWEAFRIRQGVALPGTRQLPQQLSVCSLKLSETEMRLQGFIGGSRQRHTRERRDRRQCRQLYRRKGRRKTHRQTHIGRQHRTGGWDPLSFLTRLKAFPCARHLPASQQGPGFTLGFSRPA